MWFVTPILATVIASALAVPMVTGAPVRSSSHVLSISCMGLSSGFTGQAVFYFRSRYSVGDPTFVCDDNQTTTVVGTLTGVHVHKDRLSQWSVNVSIIDTGGVVVATNSESGGRENGNVNAIVTATFDTMSVTASLEWFPSGS